MMESIAIHTLYCLLRTTREEISSQNTVNTSARHALLSCSTRPEMRANMALQLFDVADVTMGGVILPDTAREKPIAGEVVSVGPGKREEDGSRKPPQV